MAVNPLKGIGKVTIPVRPRVFVFGGSGNIGQHLVRYLKGSKYYVHMVSRWENWNEPLCGAHDSCTWKDLLDWGLPSDTVAVINLSGSRPYKFDTWTSEKAHFEEAVASRIDTNHTIKQIIERSEASPVFITASSAAIYPENTSDRCTENSEVGGGAVSEMWQAAEEAALSTGNGTRTVALRQGAVLSRMGGIHYYQRQWGWWGLAGPYGSGNNTFPFIEINDLMKVYSEIITDKSYSGPVNAVSPQKATQAYYAHGVNRALKAPSLLKYPSFFHKMAVGSHLSTQVLGNRWVYPAKLLENEFTFDHHDAQAACIHLEGEKKLHWVEDKSMPY